MERRELLSEYVKNYRQRLFDLFDSIFVEQMKGVFKKGDYGAIKDLHMILNHLIANYFSIDKEFLGIK